jgi:hypothetical protein
VAGDDGLVPLEELGHLREGEPGGLAAEADLHPGAAVVGLVEEDLGFLGGEGAEGRS